jgi:hypothetical protein
MAIVVLKIIEPPIPCKTLEKMRKEGEVDMAQRKEENVKIIIP